MEKDILAPYSQSQIQISEDQLKMIERNLELSVDERIGQLQSAINLIEEMRASLKGMNENQLPSSHK